MTTSRLKSGASLPEFTRSADPPVGALGSLVCLGPDGLPSLSSRSSDWRFAFRSWACGPCTPTKPSTPTLSDNCLHGEPFTYDPQDRHGPALAALALPLARMQGAKSFSDLTESELRRRQSSLERSRFFFLAQPPKCSDSCLVFSQRSCLQLLRCPSTTTGTSSMNHYSARPRSG